MPIPQFLIPDVLGWKFDHAEGIETRRDEKTGAVDVTAWPDTLAKKPTASDLDRYYSEWLAAGADQPEPNELEVIKRALLAKRDGGLEEVDLERARDDIMADRKGRV